MPHWHLFACQRNENGITEMQMEKAKVLAHFTPLQWASLRENQFNYNMVFLDAASSAHVWMCVVPLAASNDALQDRHLSTNEQQYRLSEWGSLVCLGQSSGFTVKYVSLLIWLRNAFSSTDKTLIAAQFFRDCFKVASIQSITSLILASFRYTHCCTNTCFRLCPFDFTCPFISSFSMSLLPLAHLSCHCLCANVAPGLYYSLFVL